MTIAEAIEILDLKVRGCNPYLSKDTDDACKLGIEALKRLRHSRLLHARYSRPLLPGETKD